MSAGSSNRFEGSKGFRNVWRYGISIYQYTPESNTAPWVATYGARASGSGTVTLKYTMEPGSAARFYGKGTLWTEADNLIAGSYQITPDLDFLMARCGGHPTDSGLLAKAGGAGAHSAAGAGGGRGAATALTDRRRAAARRVRAIAAKLRTRAKLGRQEITQMIALTVIPVSGRSN